MNKKHQNLLISRVKSAGLFILAFIIFILAIFFYFAIKKQMPLIIPIVLTALLILFCLAIYKFIYIPYTESEKILNLFALGYTMKSVNSIKVPYSKGIKNAFNKLNEMVNYKELVSANQKRAEFLALQNQINPHFLYNTLDGIRGEAIINGLETVEKMTEALSNFFRYTISNLDKLVTIEEEISNVENYFLIQKYRFGERINLNILYDDDDKEQIYCCKLPKLTLQPIIENAIIHGIEKKIENGLIEINFTLTNQRLIISISDDGNGIEKTRLSQLNDNLNKLSIDYLDTTKKKQSGIAMINVNNRIRLLFGEEYGVSIYSTVGIGTKVIVTLPIIYEENNIQ